MSIVTRYFSTTGAGAADGTTWADRAALVSAGNWSSVITGFNFSGSDSLKCMIQGGLTYSVSQALASGLFSNPPTYPNRLFFVGCDSSGVILSVPSPGWKSCMPAWSPATLPVIDFTANVGLNLSHMDLMLIKLTTNVNNTQKLFNIQQFTNAYWCYMETLDQNANFEVLIGQHVNCVYTSAVCNNGEGLVYLNGGRLFNCRIDGNNAAPGDGIYSVFGAWLQNCTVVGFGGRGMWQNGAEGFTAINNCVIADNGGDGIELFDDADTRIANCMITGNGGYGIDASKASGNAVKLKHAVSNRLRDNTSGSFNAFLNNPTDFANETAAGSDAAEYVDSASGDYRIKSGSSLWGKGYGVVDQVPSSDLSVLVL